MRRIRINQVSMRYVLGFRDLYLKYISKSGFRGLYEIYIENITQIEIDISRNYFILYLRKIKYSNIARVRARTILEINKKILSQSSNLEPNRIIFDKLANYSRSEGFQKVIKLVSLSKNQRDIILSDYHQAIRLKLKEEFEGIALYARFSLFQTISQLCELYLALQYVLTILK